MIPSCNQDPTNPEAFPNPFAPSAPPPEDFMQQPVRFTYPVYAEPIPAFSWKYQLRNLLVDRGILTSQPSAAGNHEQPFFTSSTFSSITPIRITPPVQVIDRSTHVHVGSHNSSTTILPAPAIAQTPKSNETASRSSEETESKKKKGLSCADIARIAAISAVVLSALGYLLGKSYKSYNVASAVCDELNRMYRQNPYLQADPFDRSYTACSESLSKIRSERWNNMLNKIALIASVSLMAIGAVTCLPVFVTGATLGVISVATLFFRWAISEEKSQISVLNRELYV